MWNNNNRSRSHTTSARVQAHERRYYGRKWQWLCAFVRHWEGGECELSVQCSFKAQNNKDFFRFWLHFVLRYSKILFIFGLRCFLFRADYFCLRDSQSHSHTEMFEHCKFCKCQPTNDLSRFNPLLAGETLILDSLRCAMARVPAIMLFCYCSVNSHSAHQNEQEKYKKIVRDRATNVHQIRRDCQSVWHGCV